MPTRRPRDGSSERGRTREGSRRLVIADNHARREIATLLRPFVQARLKPYAEKFSFEARESSREYLDQVRGVMRNPGIGTTLLAFVLEPAFGILTALALTDLAWAKLSPVGRRDHCLEVRVDMHTSMLAKCWRRHVRNDDPTHPFRNSPEVIDEMDPFEELGEDEYEERPLLIRALRDFIASSPDVVVPKRLSDALTVSDPS